MTLTSKLKNLVRREVTAFMSMILIAAMVFIISLAIQEGGSTAEASPCDHTETSFNCVFFKGNYDGDTIKVDIPNIHPLIGENVPVRLTGIDTPEMNSKDLCEKQVAIKAKARILSLLKTAKNIRLLNISRGSFFRIVADVWIDKYGSVSGVLLDEGLAVLYKKEVNWCESKHYIKPE